MDLLKNNQRKEVRFERGDIKLYEPNLEQMKDLKNIVNETLQIEVKDGNVKINTDMDLKMKLWRFIFRELTTIGVEIDEYSDEEFISMIDNGNRAIQSLKNNIQMLINELEEEVMEEFELNIDRSYLVMKVNSKMIKLSLTETKITELKTKMDKLFKKEKLKITYDQFIANPKLLETAMLNRKK